MNLTKFVVREMMIRQKISNANNLNQTKKKNVKQKLIKEMIVKEVKRNNNKNKREQWSISQKIKFLENKKISTRKKIKNLIFRKT